MLKIFPYVMPPYVGYHVTYAIYGAIEMHVRATCLAGDTSQVKIGPFQM